MTSPPPPPLDVVSLAIALLSLIFSHQAALALGPYAVIVVCAVGGASWSAARTGESSTPRTLWHITLWSGIGIISAVPTSELLASMAGKVGVTFEVRWLLGPVAALVAAHPEWAWSRVKMLLDRKIGNNQPPGDRT